MIGKQFVDLAVYWSLAGWDWDTVKKSGSGSVFRLTDRVELIKCSLKKVYTLCYIDTSYSSLLKGAS